MTAEEITAKVADAVALAVREPDEMERQRLLAAVEFWSKRIKALNLGAATGGACESIGRE
ncbi:MAG: hypothetical protein ACYDD1_13005 [Caulobacteraceae bacterium]